MKNRLWMIVVGVVIGLIAIVLSIQGNPANMAFCGACFIRDTAGAIGLHRAEAVQYIRPEIIGIVLGAFVIALIKKEFVAKGGSAPLTRFILGICVMIGALIFLGCPVRMMLRIAGGDLNAVVGLVGFVGGILTGIFFLNRGFSLRRSHEQSIVEGAFMPVIKVILFVLLLIAPAFIFFSEIGPGAMHAPIWISLIGGLIVGGVAYWSRLCFVGGIRDALLFKNFNMLLGFGVMLAVLFVGNVVMGDFHFSFEGQPIAHTEWIWNIAGLYLVGLGSVLLGGCPLRQLVMAGSGNSDAGVTVIGLAVGAAISHNFGLASSVDGTTPNGRIAFLIAVVVIFLIAILNIRKTSS